MRDVDFEVRRGAVNVLIGENGAGKSTLMKILAGVIPPTSGRLLLNGKEVRFSSVRDAAHHGIGIIFQELNLCPNLSVAENLSLVDPPTRFGFHIDRARQVDKARALLARLEQPIEPTALADDLRIGQQQIVEIAKSLAADVDILIMDEPTSALSAPEVEVLFGIIRDLKAHGVAIIYISHRLEEILRIGDYVTVLRDGRYQAHALVKDISVEWMVEQMVGPSGAATQTESAATGKVALSMQDVTLPRAAGGFLVDHVSLNVQAGEVVCIYGLLGAGRSELFECLMGLQPASSGRVELEGKDLSGETIGSRIRHGLVLVPEDRQREGLVQTMSVRANLTLASLRRFARLFSDPRRARARRGASDDPAADHKGLVPGGGGNGAERGEPTEGRDRQGLADRTPLDPARRAHARRRRRREGGDLSRHAPAGARRTRHRVLDLRPQGGFGKRRPHRRHVERPNFR